MKIAVIYSSKYGATEICAKKISDNIKGESKIINIKENNNINLEEYDKIAIGTSVYAGRIDKNIKEFFSKNEEILKSKVFGIFISCMNGSDLIKYVKSAFSTEIMSKAVIIKYVGGMFNFDKMNFFEKFIIKKIAKSSNMKDNLNNKVDGKNNINMINENNIKEFCYAINEMKVK